MPKQKETPLNIRLVAINRIRDYYIAPEHVPFIKEILEISAYDRNETTRLCEMTPSYFLRHVETRAVLTKEGNLLDDFRKDEIYQAYENEPTDDFYMHCHVADAIKDRGKARVWGKQPVSMCESREEAFDAVLEHLRANSIL